MCDQLMDKVPEHSFLKQVFGHKNVYIWMFEQTFNG